MRLSTLLALALGCGRIPTEPVPDGWLMAILAAPPGASSPEAHEVRVLRSEDGRAWRPHGGFETHPGSVPDLVQRGEEVLLFDPHHVRVMDRSTGRWTAPDDLVMHEGDRRLVPYDPSAVLDEVGRVVLFFLEYEGEEDPAGCPPMGETCTKRFRSATEVAGSEGRRFEVDPGVRLEVVVEPGQVASDPDVFPDGAGWAMAWQQQGALRYGRSADLRGTYTPAGELSRRLSVPSVLRVGDDLWIYGHWQARGGATAVGRGRLPSLAHAPVPSTTLESVLQPQELPPPVGPDWRVGAPSVILVQ